MTSRGMLVIWNPGAGGGSDDDLDERRDEIRTALARQLVGAELFESDSEDGSRQRIAEAIDQGVTTIVAAGGDGTVRSVAFQLLGSKVALGILPLGTAMNVANSLGIPLELDGAAEVLAAGSVRAIDVGEVRGTPFLEIASIGLGAEVLAGATHVSEGRLHVAFDLLRTAVRHRRTRVRLQLDGREVRARALSIAVANGRFTGRAVELAPNASLDDGRFDVLVFEGFGGIGLAWHLARVLLGRKHDDRIRHYRAAAVRVSTHRPLPVRVDSRDLGSTPVSLVTRVSGLLVVAPEP
ncbi:MAG TPA: diacylglycerol kinase family protein [Candidatus Limnocylindria bacterium]|nr:diacylglycerol kinase family protein [Candidatus Limnocylindria bacterium]